MILPNALSIDALQQALSQVLERRGLPIHTVLRHTGMNLTVFGGLA